MVYIEPPLEFQNNGNLQNDIQVGVQKMADILAKYYRQYPDQWLMFQKIWEDDNDG
jgi:lauroyl/myristoyl acyltransferase